MNSINNLLSSIFYNYFHRLFFIRESMDKKLKKFYFVLVMTCCVPPCFRSNHSSKLDRFPQYCDGETSSGLHCYAFVRCGSIQSKVIFAVSQCLRLFVKLFPMFSWQSNSQKVNTLKIMFIPKFYSHRLKILKTSLPIESKLSNLIIITFFQSITMIQKSKFALNVSLHSSKYASWERSQYAYHVLFISNCIFHLKGMI